jgi:hypothetical protein
MYKSKEMFLFFNKPTPILGPTQSPLQRKPGVTLSGGAFDHSNPSSTKLRRIAIPVLPAYVFTTQTETTLIRTGNKRLQGKWCFFYRINTYCSFETLVRVYLLARRNIPEDLNFQWYLSVLVNAALSQHGAVFRPTETPPNATNL